MDPRSSPWATFAYIAAGFVSDRLVVARMGWTLERTRDWLLFGAAHWFWPLSLVLLGVREVHLLPLRRWARIALYGWST